MPVEAPPAIATGAGRDAGDSVLMPKRLAKHQVEQYHRDGYVAPIPVLSVEEVHRFLAAYEELETALGGKPKATELGQLCFNFRWAWDLVRHKAVLDAVEDVLGPNIICWADSVFPKQARDPGFITFHQDGTYWGLSSTQVTTAWIALTESTPENGCMRVVPGTHTDQIQPHKETWADDNLLSRGQEIQVDVDERDVVDIVLQPGEMSLHHVQIIHGSNANDSDHKRIGYAPRYVTPEVRQVQIEGRQPAVLARGRDDYHHFDLIEQAPPDDPFDAVVERHLHASRQHLEEITATEAATS